eukprot:Opistho-1_new@48533
MLHGHLDLRVDLLRRRALNLHARDERRDDAGLRVGADGDDEHATNALHDARAAEEERALAVLADEVRLARHRALVHLEVVAVDHDAVRSENVAHLEANDVAHHKVKRRHFSGTSIANYLDRDVLLDGIQLAELLLLLVVVHGRDRYDNHDGDENRNTLDPVEVAGVLDSHAQNKRDGAGNDEHNQRQVVERVPHQLEDRGGFLWGNVVGAVEVATHSQLRVIAAETRPHIGTEATREPIDAAKLRVQAPHALVALAFQERLQLRNGHSVRRHLFASLCRRQRKQIGGLLSSATGGRGSRRRYLARVTRQQPDVPCNKETAEARRTFVWNAGRVRVQGRYAGPLATTRRPER